VTKQPTVRMFAGPNGSGKSTLARSWSEAEIGIFLNADEVEKELNNKGFLRFDNFEIQVDESDWLAFISNSKLAQRLKNFPEVSHVKVKGNLFIVKGVESNSYFSALVIEFIRMQLLKTGQSFAFETVMSHSSKVEFLDLCKKSNYATILYFVSTESPKINVSRVKNRVSKGGHSVPEEKIVSRYYRSLDLLIHAIKVSDQAFIFDNSGIKIELIATIENGRAISINENMDMIPGWFDKYLLQNI
jgi:predicted ABC-type ATPase